jgi:hypothetical protein
VDEATFQLTGGEVETVLLLGGRNWRAGRVDWSKREAYVEPIPLQGRSLWIGDGMPRASPSAKPRNGPYWERGPSPFTRGVAALRPESLADDALESLKFAFCTLAPSQKL